MSVDSVRNLLSLSYVPRWSIVPMLRQQYVAEHSFRVAAITLYLTSCTDRDPLSKIRSLEWALIHDASECVTGDIPASVKDVFGDETREMESLLPWYKVAKSLMMTSYHTEMMTVKVADLLESAAYIRAWGAVSLRRPILRAHDACKSDGIGICDKLLDQAMDKAEELDIQGPALEIWAAIGEGVPV